MSPSEEEILVVAKVLAPEPWEHYIGVNGELGQAGKSYLNRAKNLLDDRSNELRDVLVKKLIEDGVLTERTYYSYEDEQPDLSGKVRHRTGPMIDPDRAKYIARVLKRATFWKLYTTAPVSYNPDPFKPGA